MISCRRTGDFHFIGQALSAPRNIHQYLTDITAVSSKGQVVLPKAIRERLQIVPGVKMMVLSDGISILLKPIPEPDITEFRELMDAAASWASDAGMTEDDISDAIKTVRKRRKQTT